MKWVVWIVFALLALLWTGTAVIVAGLTDWAAAQIASGAAVQAGTALANWPVPDWVALWADPALLRAMQESALWALQATRDLLPALGSLLGWLVPLVWVGWGVGLVLLLAGAALAHLLIGRGQRMVQQFVPATSSR